MSETQCAQHWVFFLFFFYAKITYSFMKGGGYMKQVKMNLDKELTAYLNTQKNYNKKKQYLKKARKILFILGGGIGCFMLGSKCCEACISIGLAKIYSNYPDVEKTMFESLKDYCVKNNI